MRRFHSYGPVDAEEHYSVERRDLIKQCVQQLVGNPGKPGHYFTIWGPRQTGKTWIMRRAVEEIRARYGDKFIVGVITLQSVIEGDEAKRPLRSFLEEVPDLFEEGFQVNVAAPKKYSELRQYFKKNSGVFDRPVILLLDEFDSLPPQLIDRLVSIFRKIYLARKDYWLHGLALVGVRAVLGIENNRGSPFNVQRAMHIPNLTADEVRQMFDQYRAETGQVIEQDVVDALYKSTRGQPGLVGWFGELLTEKYHPGKDKPITMAEWERVFMMACQVEPNNTMLNLIKKGRGPYRKYVMGLFGRSDVPFSFEADWCNYLYMNGLIDTQEMSTSPDKPSKMVCRFSSPFVQFRLHAALTGDVVPWQPVQAVEWLDELQDVFTDQGIDAAALLKRYRGYLVRLKEADRPLFTAEELRTDLELREAAGHFHLYAWLKEALHGRRCFVTPEFPTGNGKVDLFLWMREHRAVIEVKSHRNSSEVIASREQAARYARSQNLTIATLAVFVSTNDERVLAGLTSDDVIEGVRVVTVPIPWV